MSKAVIFLDFDGVLNTEASLQEGINIDPRHVTRVAALARQYDSEVVVTSAWRHVWTLAQIDAVLSATGLAGVMIDATPTISGAIRGEEIAAWLDCVPGDTHYVILDDDADFLPEQMPRLVRTDVQRGFDDEALALARQLLGAS